MATPRLTPTPQDAHATNQHAAPPPPDPHRPVAELTARPAIVQQMIGAEGGFVDHYYNDQGGNCTFGAGSLVHMGPCSQAEMQQRPTPEQMQQRLAEDLRTAEDFVRRRVQRPLTQEQFDALVSLTYNAGPGAHLRGGHVTGAQPVYDAINQNGPEAAGQLILTTAIHVAVRDPHNPNRVVGHTISRGLQNRRQREFAVYQGRAQ